MKTLAKKIADVMSVVKHPPQSGHNKHNGYHYSTRDDIFGAIRQELAARGVAVFPTIDGVRREPTGAITKSSAPILRVMVTVGVMLLDSETGETLTQIWEGESQTHDEKGIPQAVTQALRFWAVNTFMLLDGSDEQMTGHPGQVSSQPVTRQEAPPEDPRVGIIKTLRRLGFAAAAIRKFVAEVARREQVADFNDMSEPRLMVWYQGLIRDGDDAARAKVQKVLAESAA